MEGDQVIVEVEEDQPEALPIPKVLELARAKGLLRVRDARLPRPEGLPYPGWYQTQARTKKNQGRRLLWRWAANGNGTRPHDVCPCGSGRLFGKCCMKTKSKVLGPLD